MDNAIIDPACDTCRFFFKHEDGAQTGTCYRFPPMPAVVKGGLGMLRPEVGTDEFCGEHEKRD